MTRPGVNILNRAAPPPRGVPSDTATAFVVGLADHGPTNAPVMVQNLTEFEDAYGPRVAYSLLYDWLETFFREGGTNAWVVRIVGPAATVDTVTLNDVGAAPAIAVDSVGEGATNLTVDVDAGVTPGTYILHILDGGVEVETSPELADNTAAAAWAASTSRYVRIRNLGANIPAPTGAASALAGGTDDRAAITDADRTAALDLFSKQLGRGQVVVVNGTTTTVHLALLAHAAANERFALLDPPDTGSNTTLAASADAIRAGVEDPSYGMLTAPWITIPGLVRGTTRTVPPSALAAGLIARSDAMNGNPNVPAAGSNGEARWAVGLSQVEWTDAVREALNEEGVNVFRTVYGALRLYGFRTAAATDDPYLAASNARLRMAITGDAELIGEDFMFAQIDGRGQKIAEWQGALLGMLQGYWTTGALYGEAPEEAFAADTGPSVNTPATLANNELRAVLSCRMSPFAEMVTIEIVKVPPTEAI